MHDNTELIAEIKELFDEGWCMCRRNGLGNKLLDALEQAERDLTNLGMAFRDYKIVHPEGSR